MAAYAGKSVYAANANIQANLRGGNRYVALLTTQPTGADGTGLVEVAAAEYQRQQVTFAAPLNGSTSNSGDVVFPQAQGSWGTVVGFAIYDAQTNGNLLYTAAVAVSKQIDAGEQAKFAAGQLVVNEAVSM